MTKSRVMMLASYAPSLRNFRGDLIEDIRHQGHKVHAAAPGLTSDLELQNWLEARGVVCHDIPLARTGLNPFSDLKLLFRLIRLMRESKPDLVVSYTIKPVIWGLIAASLVKVPSRVGLITGLGYAFTGKQRGLRSFISRIVRVLYRFALRRATLLFFQNPDDRDDFDRLGLLPKGVPVKLVAGSGVDIEEFSVSPFPLGPVKFLLIARLLGDKGIREYVEAARNLRAIQPNVEFHLVGGTDPSPDGIPEQEVAKWNTDGDVIWHGHKEDVRASIRNSHVYVLPSYREGAPRTVLEAMAMGRPVITTDAPGCRQTVEDRRNGFLVPVGDTASLIEAIQHFLNNPELIEKMGFEARAIVEQIYDVKLVNSAMLTAMGLRLVKD